MVHASWVRRLAGTIGSLLLLTSLAEAQAPWRNLAVFKRLEVDPNNDFPLRESHGPWLIMCVSFTGPEAGRQARELVHELRSQHKLPAYSHLQSFDYSQGTQGRGLDRFGTPQKMKYRVQKVDEVAVLVGDYPAIDDALAR